MYCIQIKVKLLNLHFIVCDFLFVYLQYTIYTIVAFHFSTTSSFEYLIKLLGDSDESGSSTQFF